MEFLPNDAKNVLPTEALIWDLSRLNIFIDWRPYFLPINKLLLSHVVNLKHRLKSS